MSTPWLHPNRKPFAIWSIFILVMLALAAGLSSGPAQVTHEFDFQLDGDVSNLTTLADVLGVGGGGAFDQQTIDWQDIFDSSGVPQTPIVVGPNTFVPAQWTETSKDILFWAGNTQQGASFGISLGVRPN